MQRLPLLLAAALAGACTTASAAPTTSPAAPAKERRTERRLVRYEVAIPDPARRWVEVTMTVEHPGGLRSDLALPAWAPGSYLVRDFARNLDGLRAEDLQGRPLALERLDKQTWRIRHGSKGFRARYRIYAGEPGVRTSAVDDRHATLNGPTLFLYLIGDTARPAELRFTRLPAGWSAHGALPQTAPGSFRAASYDVLVDTPFELGAPVVQSFDESGARIELVFAAPAGSNGDPARMAKALQPVIRAFARAMGGLPLARYVFLLVADDQSDGGLEHADSSLLEVKRDSFADDAGYQKLLSLAAHEFFHLWNVKRIRDAALVPYDYSREDHSELLWFHEGFTTTMSAQILVRAGVTPPADYLRELGVAWTAYLDKPGRNHASLRQLSYEAWIKLYKPSPGHYDTAVSYYEKGNLLGVCLDLELRLRSRGKGSLAGVFRRLMASHGARGVGITAADITAAASAEAGSDMAEFFRRHVDGTEELPLPELLARAGVRVEVRAPWQDERSPLAAQRRRSFTGLVLASDRVRAVIPDSPAARAGLMPGDEVIAVAGRRVRSGDEAAQRLADHAPGQTVALAFFRAGRLEQRTLTVGEDPRREHRFTLAPPEGLSADVLAVREGWLAVDPP